MVLLNRNFLLLLLLLLLLSLLKIEKYKIKKLDFHVLKTYLLILQMHLICSYDMLYTMFADFSKQY